MGSSQRQWPRSMGTLWPMGKLSSERSGCSSTSTSSMIKTPECQRSRICNKRRPWDAWQHKGGEGALQQRLNDCVGWYSGVYALG